MQRRGFIRSALAAAGALALPELGRHARAAGRYHLRYAPRLDFLADQLAIPQRLEVFAQHGLSQPGMDGLLKCFEEYRKADSW